MNKVKQMPSNVRWNVDYEGYSFHITMGFDCKDIYDVNECSCDSDFEDKFPEDSQDRINFIYEMTEFLQDKIKNDHSIWENSL